MAKIARPKPNGINPEALYTAERKISEITKQPLYLRNIKI